MGGMTFEQWLRYGQQKNYCSPDYCQIHEGVHNVDIPEWEEQVEAMDGEIDHCWRIVHLY